MWVSFPVVVRTISVEIPNITSNWFIAVAGLAVPRGPLRCVKTSLCGERSGVVTVPPL